LNSFGAFLARDFSEDKRQSLRRCKSLDEVKALVGEAYFQDCVTQFDAMNVQVISLFEHKARSLETFLAPEERGLIADLMGLPSLLYFRRNK
jgi:hypothetical protein